MGKIHKCSKKYTNVLNASLSMNLSSKQQILGINVFSCSLGDENPFFIFIMESVSDLQLFVYVAIFSW